MATLLQRSGWAVTPTGYTKDGGIDVVAVKTIEHNIPCEMLVQCKRYAGHRPVGVSVVREVVAVRLAHRFHHAMIATTSHFTKGAQLEAHEWKLDLRNRNEILDWCNRLVFGT